MWGEFTTTEATASNAALASRSGASNGGGGAAAAAADSGGMVAEVGGMAKRSGGKGEGENTLPRKWIPVGSDTSAAATSVAMAAALGMRSQAAAAGAVNTVLGCDGVRTSEGEENNKDTDGTAALDVSEDDAVTMSAAAFGGAESPASRAAHAGTEGARGGAGAQYEQSPKLVAAAGLPHERWHETVARFVAAQVSSATSQQRGEKVRRAAVCRLHREGKPPIRKTECVPRVVVRPQCRCGVLRCKRAPTSCLAGRITPRACVSFNGSAFTRPLLARY